MAGLLGLPHLALRPATATDIAHTAKCSAQQSQHSCCLFYGSADIRPRHNILPVVSAALPCSFIYFLREQLVHVQHPFSVYVRRLNGKNAAFAFQVSQCNVPEVAKPLSVPVVSRKYGTAACCALLLPKRSDRPVSIIRL